MFIIQVPYQITIRLPLTPCLKPGACAADLVKASGEDDKTRRTKRLRAASAKEELPLARSETPTTPRLSGGRVHELATLYLAEQDLEVRFQVRAIRGKGKVERGLDLLAKAQGKSSPDSR